MESQGATHKEQLEKNSYSLSGSGTGGHIWFASGEAWIQDL